MDEISLTIEGQHIKISNPEKILWTEPNITKLEYMEYLLHVADYLLPHARDRMLVWWLYPHGNDKKKIEKRSMPASAPKWLAHTFYKDKKRILLNDRATLAWVANYGAMELHVPFDKHSKQDYPTELVFDLDPSGVNDFTLVRNIALQLKEVLDSMRLASFVKTSGKSGLQVFVPIQAKYTFEQTRRVNTFIANYIAEKNPDTVTLDRVVERRGTKLYFDYLQLWKGRTIPVAYSVRATPQGTISTPVQWSEVEHGFEPADFTIHTIPQRLK